MAKRSLQGDLAKWKQVCGQAKDGLHPTAKLTDIIKSTGLSASTTYIGYYKNAGILCSPSYGKLRITDEFLTKGNREEMMQMFYMFVDEQVDKDRQRNLARKLANAVDEARDPVVEPTQNDLEERIMEAIILLEDNDYVVWHPDRAKDILTGLKLIAGK